MKGSRSPSTLARSLRGAGRLPSREREAPGAKEAGERQARRLEDLVETCLKIHATTSVDAALAVSAAEARKLFDAHVAIGWLSEPGKEPRTHTSLSSSCASGEVLAEELVWLEAPLRAADGAHLGSLRVGVAPAFFGPDDEPILSRIARSAALAIDKARVYEASQEATRAREEVLAIVAHDLRNPLNAISMSAALLRQDVAPRDLPLVDRIQRAMARMNRLVGDLLDATCLEQGRLQVAIRREPAAAIANEAIDAVQPVAAARGCTIASDIADADAFVLADRDRLLQVFSNLLRNAIKFSPESGVVTVGLKRDGGSAIFSVADDGPGIEARYVDRLFDRYSTASPPSRDGAGLGLYIARGIIEAHNGCMRVESEGACGTRFVFSIPLAGHRQGEEDTSPL